VLLVGSTLHSLDGFDKDTCVTLEGLDSSSNEWTSEKVRIEVGVIFFFFLFFFSESEY